MSILRKLQVKNPHFLKHANQFVAICSALILVVIHLAPNLENRINVASESMVDPTSKSQDLSANSIQLANASELEQRLGLYQVFLKLYEHHRELLDEILDLEDANRHRIRGVWQYIQAGVHDGQPYLDTNLLEGRSQRLVQPQYCWIIGRDRKAGLPIQDKRLSRRHALIRYVDGQGFFLKDLDSTNGTYLNGEPLRRATPLKDGDRVRLGSLFFIFFLNSDVRTLAELTPDSPDELLLVDTTSSTGINSSDSEDSEELVPASSDELLPGSDRETFMFPRPLVKNSDSSNLEVPMTEHSHSESDTPDLSTAQKADILDRFLNR